MPRIITIAREYGSGGRLIEQKVAEKVGLFYYDNEVIDLAAKEMGMDVIIAINVIDYENALIEAKTGVHSLINALTLSQKELIRIKTKADLIINLKLKDISMFGFKKKESISAIEQGYVQTKKKTKAIKALFA